MSKVDFERGSSTVEDLFEFMAERHGIWLKRDEGRKKPWTCNPIFLDYKFTNIFRQLDTGTLVLNELLSRHKDASFDMIMWTVCWYRMFNWKEHGEYFYDRPLPGFGELEEYIREEVVANGKQIFTGAHMTTGRSGEKKYETYLGACRSLWKNRIILTESCKKDSMYEVFLRLINQFLIGRFVGYEIVCDLIFTPLLCQAKDRNTWANMGPGAQRGLQRLGLIAANQSLGCKSMVELYKQARKDLPDIMVIGSQLPERYPAFELREIEHSLCEFDKYCRVLYNQGSPRGRYKGRR